MTPEFRYAPATVEEVLDILNRHRGKRIRTVGSLHCWSDAIECRDVLLDLRHLNQVAIETNDGRKTAVVQAGCQIKRLIVELDKAQLALPSIGLITEQTIAGATSTGTHGSGRNSLSHYLMEVTFARYDTQTGRAGLLTVSSGSELRAARCALGCLGVIVSVGVPVRPQFQVEEFLQEHFALSSVLAMEQDWELQQFYIIPWSWKLIGHHRREVDRPRSSSASIYRLHWFLMTDVLMHVGIILAATWIRWAALTRWFVGRLLPFFIVKNWHVIDKSYDQLTMEHELFRHLEMELFVKRSRLPEMVEFSRHLLTTAGGARPSEDETFRRQLQTCGLTEEVDAIVGEFVHHYPICVRRILPDDTLISPASDDGSGESWHAVSFITYEAPEKRDGFFRLASILARAAVQLFGARPHWGKYCPVEYSEIRHLYPELPQFHAHCDEVDPDGVHRNDFAMKRLGLSLRSPFRPDAPA